jgi:hypothetical protein
MLLVANTQAERLWKIKVYNLGLEQYQRFFSLDPLFQNHSILRITNAQYVHVMKKCVRSHEIMWFKFQQQLILH